MASDSFRETLGSLGWSRRDPDLPVRTSSTTPILSKIQNLNPFSSASGWIRLPTDENPGAPLPLASRREEEDAWYTLSRWDRMLVFGGLNLASLVMFVLCFAMFPILFAVPTKFAALWSMASVLFLASWAALMGPITYLRHLVSGPRLPFTAVYFGAITMTLVSSLRIHSKILTLLFSIVQLVALFAYLVSYFPMGTAGLKFGGQVVSNRVSAWMRG